MTRRAATALALVTAMVCAGTADIADAQQVGVNTHLAWYGVTRAQLIEQLDAANASGASLVRFDVGWSTLEPAHKGAYDPEYLRRVDAVIDALQARRLEALVVLVGTPCWASTAPAELRRKCAGRWWERQVQFYPPADPRDYADAMAHLAAHYGRRVRAWEVWNEPNIVDFWRPAPSAATYAALVRATYARVKAASPASTVLAGSLSGADDAFTERLYANGIGSHFDGFSIHPYTPSPLWRGRTRDSFVDGVPAIRDVMSRWGDSRPLWLTELGWNTSSTRGAPDFWRNGVSEATQAAYLEQALTIARRWPYVRAAVWYSLQDGAGAPADYAAHFGLRRRDGTYKPSFAAMVCVTSTVPQGSIDGLASWTEHLVALLREQPRSGLDSTLSTAGK